ncbi:MAG: hypothetical protein ACE5E5_13255 [Phycisphaerae bacterium]
MRKWVLTILMVGSYAAMGRPAEAAPKPKIAPATWQVDFAFDDPQRITLKAPGDLEPTTYWYLLFTVTNNTGRDVPFYPSFRLVTDALQVVEGGAGIAPHVYEAIFARHRLQAPYITEPFRITGTLLQGEENARMSVAVFRMFDANASKFTIYVSGLSGDVERVRNPDFDPTRAESDSNVRFFMLRRTLAIDYALPGDEEARFAATPMRRSRRWIMR